jgi:uncharacterized repeat protein (TIGR01451 family)
MSRTLAVVCAFALAVAMVVPAAAAPTEAEPDRGLLEEASATEVHTGGSRTDESRKRLAVADEGLFIVRLTGEPVASYEGGVPGLARTKPDTARGQRLDADSPAAQRYQRHLAQQRAGAVRGIEQRLARSVRVEHVYDLVINGFAAHFTPEEAVALLDVPGVVDVEPDELLELHTDNGAAWIGAESVWGDGSDPDVGTRGEGIVVGIIDTGINPSNPSFSDPGPVDGYAHTNPLGDGGHLGVCDPSEPAYDPDFACNDKLIGAWDFVLSQTSPANDARDIDGHGSHTASTAAGNRVEATVVSPANPELTLERTISGVAPHASIISYRACAAGCPTSATNASINQAVADGVDVINYSIGGGSTDPWGSSNAIAFLNARDAGVFVATSAGNSGPGAGTVGSPADAPWLLSVGASTHDRNLFNAVTGLTSNAGTLDDIKGKGFSEGLDAAPIVYAGDVSDDPMCLEEFAPNTFDGEIVICDRGINPRVEKGAHVLAGGAGGMILHNDAASGGGLSSDAHVLPAVHITHADGLGLRTWLAEGTGHEAAISGADLEVDDRFGDVQASFSSRGPNAQIDVISPNVTAPGVDIIAAYGTGDPQPPVWNIISGTSMSSPHAAGAGALLAARHPDWSPDQIQAALMTTSLTVGQRKEDGSTPADWFDIGAGRIDVAAAAQAGFVLDESRANYLAADPSEDGDPKALNLPSLANSQCLGTCAWTRTITATTDATWNVSAASDQGLSLDVSPSAFSLTAGESQELTITADVDGADVGDWRFGEVVFTSSAAPRAHFPVAVIPTAGVLPDRVDIDTRRDAGSQLVAGLQAKASAELTVDVHGLTRGTLYEAEVSQDPSNGNPYSPLDGVWWDTFEVGADSARLVAEILDTTAPDLDLFIGTGATPSAATEVCSGTTATSLERCGLDDPATGTWWVLVQAWAASGTEPDPFTLSVGVVPGSDEGTMSVEAPASLDQGEPFDVRVFWDAALEAGERWYGAFSLGSDADSRGDIGTIGVDLVRHADDVTKTANVQRAERGDTVTYELTVEPNVTSEDLEYTLTDTIPDGLTYVDGSVTGGARVEDGVVSWTGTMPTAVGVEGGYVMATNATDDTCAVPFGAGGYVDLSAYGIGPAPGVAGDTVAFTAFTSGAPFHFFGREYTGVGFTDDGFAVFDVAGHWGGGAASPWDPQAIPSTNQPNNLIAALWHDLEITHDAAANRGVALVTLGGDGPAGRAIIDYRGVHAYGDPNGETYDFQVFVQRQPVPGTWGIAIAYNDLGALTGQFTVGVENAAGTRATALVNQEPAAGTITDDTVVCFAYEGPTFDPHVITYEATVDVDAASGEVVNEVVHDTDDAGSQPAVASTSIAVPEWEIEAIEVEPANLTLRVGETAELAATARFADGTSLDVSHRVAWTSDAAVATVSDAGLVTATGGGTTTVTASLGGAEGTAQVTVTGRISEPGPPPGRDRPAPPSDPGRPGR